MFCDIGQDLIQVRIFFFTNILNKSLYSLKHDDRVEGIPRAHTIVFHNVNGFPIKVIERE